MGKASKWFRGILGLSKKPNDPSPFTSSSSSSRPGESPHPGQKPVKKKWGFVKSYKEKDFYCAETSRHGVKLTIENDVADGLGVGVGVDPNKHAIAVAAATAAVAEAAVAAAHAAAAVVRLTSSGRSTTATSATPETSAASTNNAAVLHGGDGGVAESSVHVSGNGAGYGNREVWAAVKIQSHFRAYLSRRALRALKGLVKLQALVRGHIIRKETADYIRRVQALSRVQARARAGRSQIFDSPLSVSKYMYSDPATPEKFEHAKSLKYEGSMMLKRNGSKSNGNGKAINDQGRAYIWEQQGSLTRSGPIDDKRSDKILEVDTGKPHITLKRRNLFHSSHISLGSEQYSHSFTTSKESTAHQSVPSPSSCEVQSFGPLKYTQDLDDNCYFTADSSPQLYSASSKGGGDSKKGPFTPTKSDGSRSCLSGYSDHPNYMSLTESSKAKARSLSAPKQRPHYDRSSSTKRYSIHSFNDSRVNPQRVSTMHANFTNKAYPGSGRLDRLGMPVGGDGVGFSGDMWHRF